MANLIELRKKCSHCDSSFFILEADTDDEGDVAADDTQYTDGYRSNSCYGDDIVIKCPVCKIYLWNSDLPIVESMKDYAVKRHAMPQAYFIKKTEYLNFLSSKEFSKGVWREKELRIRAWWAFNDKYRKQSIKEFVLTYPDDSNLERLFALLDNKNVDDRLKRAEILRQLGRFAECLNELNDQSIKVLISNQSKKLASGMSIADIDRIQNDEIKKAEIIRALALRCERRVRAI